MSAAARPLRLTLALAVVATVGSLGIAVAEPAALAGFWSVAFFWSALPIGALFFLMLMRLVPGPWCDALEGEATVFAAAMPLAGLALLPVIIGTGALFPWAHGAGAHLAILTPWAVRITIVGIALVFVLIVAGLVRRPARSVPIATAGLIVFTLLDSWIAVDLLMSLDPRFRSSVFGLRILSVQATIALAAMILTSLATRAPTPERTALFAKLLITAAAMWGYLNFMSYLIAWSGNLPPSIPWWLTRTTGFWGRLAAVAAALTFLPCLPLVSLRWRKRPAIVAAAAALLLLGRVAEALWLVLPSTPPAPLADALAAIAGFVGLGAFFAVAIVVLARRVAPAHRSIAGSAR